MTGCVAAFDLPGMLAPMYLIGCFQAEASSAATGVMACEVCIVSGAWAVTGVAVGMALSAFDQGQKDDFGGAGAVVDSRNGCDIAIDAGLAMAVLAAKPSAPTAAGIVLRQALYMAVLLDCVVRRH